MLLLFYIDSVYLNLFTGYHSTTSLFLLAIQTVLRVFSFFGHIPNSDIKLVFHTPSSSGTMLMLAIVSGQPSLSFSLIVPGFSFNSIVVL